jgi:hypothetical protein
LTPPDSIGDSDELGMPEELERLAAQLRHSRPEPNSAFRERLRRRIEASSNCELPPARVGARIVSFASAGILLLLVGAAVTFL